MKMVKLTSPQSYRIVMFVLKNPVTSQANIARSTRVSATHVNYIVTYLKDLGLVSQHGMENLKLRDPYRLLDALSFERPLKKLMVGEVRAEVPELSNVERLVKNAEVHRGHQYAFTGYSAIAKYIEYYITYSIVHVYSVAPEELLDNFRFQGSGPSIRVLKADSPLILENAQIRQDISVVEPMQTVVDLFALGGQGRDGAIKLYEAIKSGTISNSRRIVQ